MEFYGQSSPQEDFIASRVFGDDFIGTAVEVGAFDGIRLSNCYHFYLKGWRVFNFEPHPENYAALCRNQPKAINFNFAVTSHKTHTEAVIQTTPGKPMVTGFDMPEWYIDSEVLGGRSGLQPMKVIAVCLNAALQPYHIETVDYISIDVDGSEMDVLYGFDLNAYRPRLMIIEFNHALKEMTDYLSSYGYTLAYMNPINSFWTRTQADCDAVRRAVQ